MVEEIITSSFHLHPRPGFTAPQWPAGPSNLPNPPRSPFPRSPNNHQRIKRRHLDVREALVKASEGEEQHWTTAAPGVFWAERVLIQKSTADLAQIKEAVLKARYTSIREFNKRYENTIQELTFDEGALVLVRNSRHDKDLGSKTAPRCFGRPMIVLRRTTGGSYILSELDGSISKLRFTAFQLVPHHPRNLRAVPVTKITDATPEQLDNYTYDVDPADLDVTDSPIDLALEGYCNTL
ncbi:hypothetical protein Agabi119p4_4965 [Agaricus bisporus var. burnettii]|uniref:Uncharacterized protein n=1 Tax=Agaricus bisporus var. burnettii TaxID=192524 RepID=A0A8H7F498_AGABI|nr:hypothetical protein Agabi119p4_4965 [Agaricus bisporus var. burnettii]